MEKDPKDFSIQSLIAATLQKQRDAEPKPPTGYWRSSSLGSCLCGAFLARQGKVPDPPKDEKEEHDGERLLRVWDVGKFQERWVIEKIKQSMPDGYEIDEQGECRNKDGTLVGHFDFRLTNRETHHSILYELKSCHSRKFWYMVDQKRGADLHHKEQSWSYLDMTGEDEAHIVYTSKDDLCIAEYPIFRNDESLRKLVKEELAQLNKAWRTGVPPVPILDPKDWRYKYCRYHKQCMAIAAEHNWKFEPPAGRAGDIKKGKET